MMKWRSATLDQQNAQEEGATVRDLQQKFVSVVLMENVELKRSRVVTDYITPTISGGAAKH